VALVVLAVVVARESRAEITSLYGSSETGLSRDSLAGAFVRVGPYTLDTRQLRRVYESLGYAPIWTGSGQAKADANRALAVLRDAAAEGLRAENYRYQQLSGMSPASAEQRAEFELLMTDSLVRYARELRSGHVRPFDLEDDIELPYTTFDIAAALASALKTGTLEAFLDSAPRHPEYGRLKLALARYRALATAGGWPTVSVGTTPDGENQDLLRARLAIEDETVGNNGESLRDALKRYQRRNGLEPDGVLGPRTLAALNTPVATRIKQIEANMERWRWMPRDLEPRHIAVNVPDATLKFWDGGSALLESKVVVGDRKLRTPILRTIANAVTVNPVWYVPPALAWREIWPKLYSNPSYLRSQGLVLVDGQFRQPPGPRNALGRLKFEMPNAFNVYLHDTPAKSVFERQSRTLSHGCVRVEQIASLASLAISGDPQSALGQLNELIVRGRTTRVELDEPIPVYLVYWTAIADDDGKAGFPADVYGRDPLLTAALENARDSRQGLAR
jgi:murein L,D-transpeptidase YcbB/YkuD